MQCLSSKWFKHSKKRIMQGANNMRYKKAVRNMHTTVSTVLDVVKQTTRNHFVHLQKI